MQSNSKFKSECRYLGECLEMCIKVKNTRICKKWSSFGNEKNLKMIRQMISASQEDYMCNVEAYVCYWKDKWNFN